jgi:hypothetical protein
MSYSYNRTAAPKPTKPKPFIVSLKGVFVSYDKFRRWSFNTLKEAKAKAEDLIVNERRGAAAIVQKLNQNEDDFDNIGYFSRDEDEWRNGPYRG